MHSPDAPLTPPATPLPSNSESNVYVKARSAVRACSVLTGRVAERKIISEFLQNPQGGSLYVSGPPGAGKTASIKDTCRILSLKNECHYLNCMSLTSPSAVWTAILASCGQPSCSMSDSYGRLQTYLKTLSQNKIVIILDEIDYLPPQQLAAALSLYQSLTNAKINAQTKFNCSLHLIGIANTMSLTQSLPPNIIKIVKLVHFPAYSDIELSDIISSQLGQDFRQMVAPAALSLAGKKVAASSGDLRRAMDVICHAFDSVEKERRRAFEFEAEDTKAKLAEENGTKFTSTSSFVNSKLAELTPSNAAKVTPSHIIKAFNALSKSKASNKIGGVAGLVKGLPLHSRLALACFILTLRSNPSIRNITIPNLFSSYQEILKRSNCSLKPLQRSEFSGPVTMLIDNGLLTHAAVTPSKRKLSRSSEPHLSLGSVESDIMRGLTEGVGTAENHLVELIHQEERYLERLIDAKARAEMQSTRVPFDVLR